MAAVRAGMAGKSLGMGVAEGDSVGEDQDLVIIESVMQVPGGSPAEGTVRKVFVVPDPVLNKGNSIVEMS